MSFHASVVECDGETSGGSYYELVEVAVGVSATCLSSGHVVEVIYTTHLEWHGVGPGDDRQVAFSAAVVPVEFEDVAIMDACGLVL